MFGFFCSLLVAFVKMERETSVSWHVMTSVIKIDIAE
jgi:hypothetical protein